MFKKVLVANRGEIALRIIRALRELGVQSVAVYSEPDADSLHVKLADESYCIGPAVSAKSYLNVHSIISAAEISGASAIHPGYGFLAENAKFVEICKEHNIKFIGPMSDAIQKMGDKAVAKKTVQAAGVPVVPGSDGVVKTDEEAKKISAKIGYPVLVKASAGGGGKGMRIVREESELLSLLKSAKVEAEAAFGNPEVYIEKFIENPRHIEVQILADEHGNIVHLGERDCSIQRRHQKLVEESPSPAVDRRLREHLGKAAIRAAKAVKYSSAGTIEFIFEPGGKFYFMEMNTRVQVEHPVTEMVTDIDIVKDQIRAASGEKLGYRQSDVTFKGHSIECRINAENPDKNFMPSPGEISIYLPPGGPGVRVDSHAYPGYKVLPNYDSLVAKLIVWGKNRTEAIARMKRALEEFVIDGIHTTIPFHQKVLDHHAFISGDISTNFIEKYFHG
ncbi:acetyl-CoA carboxylase biotin carboxylase subunit [candidate division WOR-1 bacterium RIFOXYA12_FULL_43_27]|uniref:Biotin carboxylase n=1 Tax=candidate division WOR-1 bacterium RIFOXYC2_FULL_46_14 TaxID=1802587 RepID=A0A1F4U7G7_UNCSA|nr:MAG: acetyl-CoA carboxylase biotin carboxylase subunit [candidate division WOR-1 bacterium RIFOXYA12_FULL_43_27]OGC19179.1 MAG: acetyl-CoA carboxylase biotin carboxylase subunit [candidate division WOR-1 bacterium RIFOXYB2_FULL_46_45]OGC30168.1 MAG: acetyl-CoA carboxylase biotin carboxylase subunit [candidate division WOR-1 bacterium RIFOXYA2_FULL_46_56]OGC40770.1 MAG: acetyl-CoA carboxylase biotin carboxylase subunit [candidate division WOR-1 bacterium RIFOXYC2_FULL_46_14]